MIKKFKIFEQSSKEVDPYGEEDWNELPFDDYIDMIKNIKGIKNFDYDDDITKLITFNFKKYHFSFFEQRGQNLLQISSQRGDYIKTETTNITSLEEFLFKMNWFRKRS